MGSVCGKWGEIRRIPLRQRIRFVSCFIEGKFGKRKLSFNENDMSSYIGFIGRGVKTHIRVMRRGVSNKCTGC